MDPQQGDAQHPALRAVMMHYPQMSVNSAIRERFVVEPDIYADFYKKLLDGDVFKHWQDDRSRFRLRCYGGPGSGKTTFAALAAERLREHNKSFRTRVVGSVFVSRRGAWDESALVQALDTIFLQLVPEHALKPSHKCLAAYAGFLRESQHHGLPSAQLAVLRTALYARVHQLERVFLVVDGLDRCGPEPSLEAEFAHLGPKVKILSTARGFDLEDDEFISTWWPSRAVTCDGEGCRGEKEQQLQTSVYWMCFAENNSAPAVLCWLCYYDSKSRIGCRAGSKQTPNVYIDMNNTPKNQIQRYVEWEIEREREQMGLASRWLVTPASLSEIQRIVERSCGNIALTRLQIERLYFEHGLQDADEEGLSREVVALFDAVVNRLDEFAIRAIWATAVSLDDESLPEKRVLFDKLLSLSSPGRELETGRAPIFCATEGLLVATEEEGSRPHFEFYTEEFKRYVTQEYNLELCTKLRVLSAKVEVTAVVDQAKEESDK